MKFPNFKFAVQYIINSEKIIYLTNVISTTKKILRSKKIKDDKCLGVGHSGVNWWHRH
jgi:hypothetical protein